MMNSTGFDQPLGALLCIPGDAKTMLARRLVLKDDRVVLFVTFRFGEIQADPLHFLKDCRNLFETYHEYDSWKDPCVRLAEILESEPFAVVESCVDGEVRLFGDKVYWYESRREKLPEPLREPQILDRSVLPIVAVMPDCDAYLSSMSGRGAPEGQAELTKYLQPLVRLTGMLSVTADQDDAELLQDLAKSRTVLLYPECLYESGRDFFGERRNREKLQALESQINELRQEKLDLRKELSKQLHRISEAKEVDDGVDSRETLESKAVESVTTDGGKKSGGRPRGYWSTLQIVMVVCIFVIIGIFIAMHFAIKPPVDDSDELGIEEEVMIEEPQLLMSATLCFDASCKSSREMTPAVLQQITQLKERIPKVLKAARDALPANSRLEMATLQEDLEAGLSCPIGEDRWHSQCFARELDGALMRYSLLLLTAVCPETWKSEYAYLASLWTRDTITLDIYSRSWRCLSGVGEEGEEASQKILFSLLKIAVEALPLVVNQDGAYSGEYLSDSTGTCSKRDGKGLCIEICFELKGEICVDPVRRLIVQIGNSPTDRVINIKGKGVFPAHENRLSRLWSRDAVVLHLDTASRMLLGR